ncbi:MAG TPA: hypothetical protein VE572_03125 [Nitrososphaeraceae archaeon]|jgi:hypothetical protein|nr:hypothetical protein [Nitrososphaeraceae archaeon]
MVDVEPESGGTNIKTYQMHENHSAAKAEIRAVLAYNLTDNNLSATLHYIA